MKDETAQSDDIVADTLTADQRSEHERREGVAETRNKKRLKHAAEGPEAAAEEVLEEERKGAKKAARKAS